MLAGYLAKGALLPDAARRTVDKFGNGGAIERVAREKEDGLEIYSVILDDGGRKMEVQTTLEGELCATEEAVSPKDLPSEVAKAAAHLCPGGVQSAERAVVLLYEVTGKDEKGATREVRITRPGTALFERAEPAPPRGQGGSESKR